MHLAQEVLMDAQCSGGSRSFARETRALNMSTVAGHQKLTMTNWEPLLRLLLLQLDKFKNSLSAILWLFSIWSKLERWKSSIRGCLLSWPKTKKIIVLKCCLILCNNELFLNWMVSCNKKWISYYNQWYPAQWLDWAEALKHFLKPDLAPEKVLVTLVVCCQSDPLQLSEFQQNHYIQEVCSHTLQKCAHDEMPWKLQHMQTALIKSQSSPITTPDRTCTTNASKVEWIGLQSFVSSSIFIWPLANRLPLFLSISTSFCRENASTTSRIQEMFSKSLLNSEAWVFTLQR